MVDIHDPSAFACPLCGSDGFASASAALNHLSNHNDDVAPVPQSDDAAEEDDNTGAGFVFDDSLPGVEAVPAPAATTAHVGAPNPQGSGAAVADPSVAEAEALAGCSKCGRTRLLSSFQDAFGVSVCFECKNADTSTTYDLITATTAKYVRKNCALIA